MVVELNYVPLVGSATGDSDYQRIHWSPQACCGMIAMSSAQGSVTLLNLASRVEATVKDASNGKPIAHGSQCSDQAATKLGSFYAEQFAALASP
jgi:hypothetical protein